MACVSLITALNWAIKQNTYSVGFVCQGWEDSQAYVRAGQAARCPVILSAGPGARAHMPVHIWAQMFHHLASTVDVPVIAHLDHGKTVDECVGALECGFTSIMFDGSALPLGDNIAQTNLISQKVRAAGASLEAELGVVGYAAGAQTIAAATGKATATTDRADVSHYSDPQEVQIFCNETDIDCLAVSIGNTHLQTQQSARIDWNLAQTLTDAAKDVPLVIHGGSGVKVEDRALLAKRCNVRKINIGTQMRQFYAQALRTVLQTDEAVFDRIEIHKRVRTMMQNYTKDFLMQTAHPHKG